MTERLYYNDSFLYEFDATVVDVVHGERPAVVLDRTAFYPTSGGQVFDTGVLSANGSAARVVEVVEDAGRILHYVDAARALTPGTRVHGVVEASRRRDHMQQHSGQHVLSAAFAKLFEMPTVSFHMGDESCTIDLATQKLTEEQIVQAETLANEIVFEDRPVTIRSVSMSEAQRLGLRKIPDAEKVAVKQTANVENGADPELRLIDFADFDLTACGGTHVGHTSQIGPILIRKTEKVRQGIRVEFVCGDRALATARRDYRTLTEAAAVFSTHIYEVPQQIRKSIDDSKAAQKQQRALLEELAEFQAQKLAAETPEQGGIKLVRRTFADHDLAFIKLVAQKLTKSPKVVAIFASTSGQPSLVFAQSADMSNDMSELMKQAMLALGGRGGGSRDMAQGGAQDAAKIEAALDEAAAAIRTAVIE